MEQPAANTVRIETSETVTNSAPEVSGAALALSYCPRCSTRLTARSCKLICPDCGYYMSCSDFY